MNFSIYEFYGDEWHILNISGINKGYMYYNNWTITNFSYYYSSNQLIRLEFDSGYNFSRSFTNFSITIYVKYYYRTGVQVSIWKTFYIAGVVWEYRFGIRQTGTNNWYYTDWVMFGVVEPVSNFQGISESIYTTQWQLVSTSITTSEYFTEEFNSINWDMYDCSGTATGYNTSILLQETLDTNPWRLVGTNPVMTIQSNVDQDAYVDIYEPSTTHTGTIVKVEGSTREGYFGTANRRAGYLTDNITSQSTIWVKCYVSGTKGYYAYATTSFSESSLTWNNKPVANIYIGQTGIAGTLPLGMTYYDYYCLKGIDDGTFSYIESSETPLPSDRPYFRDYISKIYQGDGSVYAQTNGNNDYLGLQSPVYSTINLGLGGYLSFDIKPKCDDRLNVSLILNGVEQKNIQIMAQGNSDYNQRIINVSVNSDVSFNQVKVFGYLENTEYFRLYDMDIYQRNYQNKMSGGYVYMKSAMTEELNIKGSQYLVNESVTAGDYLTIKLKTTSSDELLLTFLRGNVIQDTITLVQSDNSNFEERIVEVIIEISVEFDQLMISGIFDNNEYIRCDYIKLYTYVLTGDYYNFYINPYGIGDICVQVGDYILKIYENSVLKVITTITITTSLYTYIYESIHFIECKLYLYSQSGKSLDFDSFHIYITTTYFNSTNSYWLQSDTFKVDDNTYIYLSIYDIFYNLVKEDTKFAYYYIDIQIEIYTLKISNGAQSNSSILIQPIGSGYTITELMTPDEVISYELGVNEYTITWTNGENGEIKIYNISLTEDRLLILPSTYYQLYVSCFNFDGLGLDTNWVRLYINNLRKDFGFNILKTQYTNFIVRDFFNATLANETVYTRIYTEYNIYVQVYNLIINNNYSHSIFITIARADVNITIKQIVPAQGSINYRFLPGIDYNISYYHINGTLIGSTNITLVDNNQIVSFGFYSVEVPSPDYQLIVSCFNYNGFKLDTDWVYLYINGVQADLGPNVVDTDYNLFVITDLFGEVLSSEVVYTKNMTQYNADVTIYGLVLNNNYTHSIYIELTRPNSSIVMKQIIPAQSGVLYRFCPDTDYVISYYFINGTKIDDVRVLLETDNQIVSFGWYTAEVPAGPSKELIMGQMWLDIVVIISCFLTIISFTLYLLRKYIKSNKEKQKYIYNTNKTNLEVEGLLGKTHYFK